MIQPYLILVSSLGIFGLVYRRKNLNLETKRLRHQLEREQKKLNAASRSENLLRARISLEEKSHKIQESLEQIAMLMRKSETLFSREDFSKAEKNLIQVISLDEHHIRANQLLGLSYLHRGEWKKAELIYKKLLDLEPKEASHYGNLGLSFYYQEKYPLAREAYLNATRIDSSKDSRWVSLGQVFMKLNDPASAAGAFEKAVKLDRRNTDFLFALAEAYELAGEIKAAVRTYENILSLSPYNEDAKKKLEELEKPGEKA